MLRGEVWLVSLPGPRGSGPGYRRPAVIVSADAFNESRIETVVVAIVTSNTGLAHAPGNLLLRKGEGGLTKTSVVNVSQLFTIDRAFLVKKMGDLTGARLLALEAGLRLVLEL